MAASATSRHRRPPAAGVAAGRAVPAAATGATACGGPDPGAAVGGQAGPAVRGRGTPRGWYRSPTRAHAQPPVGRRRPGCPPPGGARGSCPAHPPAAGRGSGTQTGVVTASAARGVTDTEMRVGYTYASDGNEAIGAIFGANAALPDFGVLNETMIAHLNATGGVAGREVVGGRRRTPSRSTPPTPVHHATDLRGHDRGRRRLHRRACKPRSRSSSTAWCDPTCW